MSLASLDDEFGPMILPDRLDDWEKRFTPASLTHLDSATASSLRRFMEEVEGGWKIGKLFINGVLLIWLVDGAGTVRLAVEEVVLNGDHYELPKLQSFPMMKLLPKLGHPTLVGCGPARIGGEIRFDPILPEWSINNASGRYGFHSSRSSIHLRNVAQLFSDFGVKLTPYFYP